jgi:hypothetical protein
LVFSIPFGIGAFWLEFASFFGDSLVLACGAGLFYGTLMFLAGWGFWGIVGLLSVPTWIRHVDLDLNPYHPDEFGGLRSFGQFTILGGTYFFTGSLVIPAAVALIGRLRAVDGSLAGATYGIMGLYAAFGVLGFIIPQVQLRDKSRSEKAKELAKIGTPLNWAYTEFAVGKTEPDVDVKGMESLRFRRDVFYKDVRAIREWPYDFKVLLEIAGALLVPILVTIIQVLSSR